MSTIKALLITHWVLKKSGLGSRMCTGSNQKLDSGKSLQMRLCTAKAEMSIKEDRLIKVGISCLTFSKFSAVCNNYIFLLDTYRYIPHTAAVST